MKRIVLSLILILSLAGMAQAGTTVIGGSLECTTDDGTTCTSARSVTMPTGKALTVQTPTADGHAARKDYVDGVASGGTSVAGSLKSTATTGKMTITGPAAGTTRAKTVRDANDTVLELGGNYTPSGTWNWGTATVTWPTFNQNTTGTAANLSGTPALPNGTTVTTQPAGTNNTTVATTAYVDPLKIVTDAGTGNTAASEMYGQRHLVTGAFARTLPTAAVGMSACFMATTAAVFSLDSQATDTFILDKVALDAGDKVSSPGAAYDMICVECTVVNTWNVYSPNAVPVDGGP